MKKIAILFCALVLCLTLCACQGNEFFSNDAKFDNVDISGLNIENASKKVEDSIQEKNNQTKLVLTYEDKSFEILGSELKVPDVDKYISETFENSKPKSFFQKLSGKKQQSEYFLNASDRLVGIDEKIEEIKKQVERDVVEPEVVFESSKDYPFSVSDEVCGVKVDEERLYNMINESLKSSNTAEIEIPVFLTTAQNTKQEVLNNLSLRGSFSTNYSSSVDGRKHNVKLALSAFDGMVIEPNQEVSFNQTIQEKINDDDFKTAKIISNGEFVDGKGGGICQASTTLYNALLKADLEIKEVHPHSLAVGYVYLGFDAMVNRGSSDLVFKNNLDSPVYIKTWGDESDCFVEVYGKPFEDGITVQRRAEFVGTIPHGGDKIVPDTEGLYKDKITFKGEYYRAKYPSEGYEAKAYIQYIKDGQVISEKLIRHEKYAPTQGIIYEGCEELIEGLSLPENTVKFIPPQNQSKTTEQNVTQKIENNNPTQYTP